MPPPAAVAVAAVLTLAASAPAQPRNILVLETGAAGRPYSLEFTSAFVGALEALPPPGVVPYFEWLDLGRFEGEAHLDEVRSFLAAKYRRQPPQVVVALGDPTIRFVLASRARLWPGVPIVFAATSRQMLDAVRGQPATVGILQVFDVTGTVEAALAVLPETDTVVLVAAGDPFLAAVDRDLDAMRDRLTVVRLVDLPLAEIARQVARLPERAIVFYTQVAREPDGRTHVGRTVLRDLARVANRPIVSPTASYLGTGVLVGSFRDFAGSTADLAGLVQRVLSGEDPAAIPVVAGGRTAHFDARELERWGIAESRLPPGSDVHFRTPTIWSQYRGTVIAGGAVMALQTMLIAALIWAVRRRREAELEARRLSGRVLTAQEDERRRIARELHDGANQEIALFAMHLDLSGQGALAERARALSTDLHRLSHELHPAILDQLGLVQALQQFGEQLGRRCGMRIDIRADEWPARVPPAVAITFYRVAQEALQNAARHSGATEATVVLQGSPEGVSMSVADRGAGFSPGQGATPRLGLAGMHERLRSVGGELQVTSSPGRGTTVFAQVPPRALAALERDAGLASPAPPDPLSDSDRLPAPAHRIECGHGSGPTVDPAR